MTSLNIDIASLEKLSGSINVSMTVGGAVISMLLFSTIWQQFRINSILQRLDNHRI